MEYIERHGLYSEDDDDRELRKNGQSRNLTEVGETKEVQQEQKELGGAQ
jgi:hypothetical protein